MGGADRGRDFLAAINRSGFLLQLAVAHAVGTMAQRTPWDAWKVLLSEHAWKSSDGEGFIDLVLARAALRLVVECKRSTDDDWIFLQPQEARPTSRVRCFGTRAGEGKCAGGWYDFVTRSAPWAEFCVMRDKQRMPLESVARDVVAATNAIAVEEALLGRRLRQATGYHYVPTIVTTARLSVASVDIAAIALSDGKVPDASFSSVPYVWMQKALSTRPVSGERIYDVADAHKAKQRSVLVIEAAQLLGVLPTLNIDGSVPWDDGELDMGAELDR